MALPLLQIIHEDADLLVLNKPAGLVCHPTKGDVYSSLISRVRLHLGPSHQPHLVNRLDRETSGVMVVAKHPAAALHLRKGWENRAVQKDYLAIVHGAVEPSEHRIEAPLGKDNASPVAIKDKVRPDGAPALTEFLVEKQFQHQGRDFSLLLVRPRTGRKHQIRIHLAYSGHPLVGDKLYGADEQIYLAFVENRLTQADRARLILPYHALHARRLCFDWHDQPKAFEAEPEGWFTEFCQGV